MLRHIPLGGMHNLRDLGGYPVPGGETAWERLLRGDNPEGLTEEDLRWLLDRDITTVVDLRSDAEVGRKPDQLSGHPDFHYFHCPLLAEGDGMPNLETDVGAGYFRMLEGSGLVARALRTVAAAPGGVLFHCTAGKDRTGLMAALLLGLAGVERTDILADYQVSETYLARIIRQIKARVPTLPAFAGLMAALLLGLAGVERTDILADYQVSETYLARIIRQIKARVPTLPAFAGASKAEYLDQCLDLLEETYGSIPAYLLAIGLEEKELAALRGKLLPADVEKGGAARG